MYIHFNHHKLFLTKGIYLMNNKIKDILNPKIEKFKIFTVETLKNLNKKTKILLLIGITSFILSKLLKLVKVNIPGLNRIPLVMILLIISLNILTRYKQETDKRKRILYLILGAIPLTLVSFFIFGFLITYPFILISLLV